MWTQTMINDLESKIKFYLILYALRCIEFVEQGSDSNTAAYLNFKLDIFILSRRGRGTRQKSISIIHTCI